MAQRAPETVGRVVSQNLRGMHTQRVFGIPEQGILGTQMAGLAEVTNPCVRQEDLLDPVAPAVRGRLEQAAPFLYGLWVPALLSLSDVLLDLFPEHPLVVPLKSLPLLLPFGTKDDQGRHKTRHYQNNKQDA
jgi:hypothetical protein